VFRDFDPKGGGRWGGELYGAFLLRRGGEPRWVDLGASSDLLPRIAAFRQALADPLLRAPVEATGRALYDALLAPLEKELEGVRSLLIAPDGALNLIPFSALIDKRGTYLAESHRVSYLTSGRDLLRITGSSAPRGPPVIVADPDYAGSVAVEVAASPSGDGRTPRRSHDLEQTGWLPLPGTRQEARAIAKLMDVKPLLGASAQESAVKHVRGPRVLHIATHGFFLADQKAPDPGSRSLRAAVNPERASPLPVAAAHIENPLLRAGLVLAGANRPAGASDDGILTALELAGLDLSGTQLVVLSACDTGLGTLENGEGVYGLRRAVVLAGADAQVATLWKVDDKATRTVMTRFYEELEAGLGRAEALRRIQLEMARATDATWSHPFYWASFLPIGAWGPVEWPEEHADPGSADR
jgi:CHAT domain-containing protein